MSKEWFHANWQKPVMNEGRYCLEGLRRCFNSLCVFSSTNRIWIDGNEMRFIIFRNCMQKSLNLAMNRRSTFNAHLIGHWSELNKNWVIFSQQKYSIAKLFIDKKIINDQSNFKQIWFPLQIDCIHFAPEAHLVSFNEERWWSPISLCNFIASCGQCARNCCAPINFVGTQSFHWEMSVWAEKKRIIPFLSIHKHTSPFGINKREAVEMCYDLPKH